MILGNIKLIVKRLREAMAIVEEGDTASQSIAKDKYVMWKGTLCKTDSAITQGGTFATSGAGKNLTAKTEGLGGEIATLNSNMANKVNTSNITNNLTTTESGYVLDARQGKALNDKIRTITFGSVTGTTSSNANLGLGHNDNYIISAWCSDVSGTLVTLEKENGSGWWAHCVSDGASPSPKTSTRLTINFYYI